MTYYMSRFQEVQTDKWNRGWYIHPVEVDSSNTANVQYKRYAFSRSSRNEAMEKFAKQFVGLTHNKEIHHTGLVCLDYLFDGK